MADLKPVIGKLATGATLSEAEARDAFDLIMSGDATPAQIGGFLMALRIRGETIEEIAGAVATMRAKALPVAAPDNSIDVVGTGGDASGTYNISTAAAFVVAGAGVPVAKHGNRSLSSKSGAADVLKALGVDVNIGPAHIARCIRDAGIGFMFAPAHHVAMRHVGPVRQELGIRTIFNLLGPLSNPAGVRRQMTGVFAEKWVEPIAGVLLRLGCKHAWVVHGSDGLDEITTTGPTRVAELKDGAIRLFEIGPEDAGLQRAAAADLKGGDAEKNANALRSVLAGKAGAHRDIVLINAGAALIVAEMARNLNEGIELAARSIDTGAAAERLERLIAVSTTRP